MSVFPFAESWERYKIATSSDPDLFANLTARYTSVGGLSIIAGGRTGQCLKIENGAISKTLPHAGTIVTGFAVKFNQASASAQQSIYSLSNNNLPLYTLAWDLDGTLSIYAGTVTGSIIGVTERALFTNKWYYLESFLTFSGSSPITVAAELRVNGNIVISGSHATSISTSQTLSQSATANYHTLSNAVAGLSGATLIDDFYIKDTSGYYGDVRIVALYADGDGFLLQWDPSTGTVQYLMINGHPAVLTTFISTLTPGNISTFTWQDCPGFSGTIKAINISMLAQKDDEGTKSFKIVVGNSGTEASSDEFFLSDISPEYYEMGLELDPATGLAWTQAGFNAKEFGVKLIS